MECITIKQTEEYLSVVLEEKKLSELEYKVIMSQQEKFFLPPFLIKHNGRTELFYTIPASCNSLGVLAENMETEMLSYVKKNLEQVCVEIENNGFLRLEHLSQNLNHIFWDNVSETLKMIYLPILGSNTAALSRETVMKGIIQELEVCNKNLHVSSPIPSNKIGINNPYFIVAETGEKIEITKSNFIIGKNQTVVDGVIYNHSAVSRKHCLILLEQGRAYIQDMGSTNGTYVNQRSIKGMGNVELHDNDKVYLAECLLIFYKG